MRKLMLVTCILTGVNLLIMALFWLRYSAPVLAATATFHPGVDSHAAFLAAQANHYALLQLFLIIFSMVLALLALWGYSGLKNAAEDKATATVRAVVPDLVKAHLAHFHGEQLTQMSIGTKMEVKSRAAFKEDMHRLEEK